MLHREWILGSGVFSTQHEMHTISAFTLMSLCCAYRGSQVVSAEPSVDDQIKRLQEDEAKTGDGLGRRSSSMDRLYGMYEPKTPHSSRLRSSSTADPEDIQVIYFKQ